MDEYISREEVVKEIKSRIFDADDAWESGYNTAMAGIMEWIEHMPTADVQPVKHGRWLDNGIVYTCLECNSSVPKSIFVIGCDFEGCPYCFARMDCGLKDGDNNG